MNHASGGDPNEPYFTRRNLAPAPGSLPVTLSPIPSSPRVEAEGGITRAVTDKSQVDQNRSSTAPAAATGTGKMIRGAR